MSEENVNQEVVETEVVEEKNGIRIADDVVAVIAGIAASDVPGVAGMSGGLVGGISEILGRKNLSKGVKVQVGEKDTSIDINIIVEYGARIPDVSWEIQNRVKKAVETMTGLNVTGVNIYVQGVNIEKDFKKEEVEETE